MTGGRNNQGVITSRHRGGGHKRRYRLIDFRRNKDGVPAQGRFDPIRPEPQLADCSVELRRRREALHPGSRRTCRRAPSVERCGCSAVGRQLLAAEKHSAGNDGSQYRIAAWAWRAIVPIGWLARDVGRPRGRLGPDHAAERRNSPHPGLVPSDDRVDRQCGPHECRAGQGRSEAMDRAIGRMSAARP